MTVSGWVFVAVFVLMIIGIAVVRVGGDRKRRPFAISDQEVHTASGVVRSRSAKNPARHRLLGYFQGGRSLDLKIR